MPCYNPLQGYRSQIRNDSGKRSIVFSQRKGYADMPVTVACGQCIGCRLERSRQWAIRCVHESKMYDRNCFLTLTYNDNNLPKDGSLNMAHFQKFMKRLRKKYGAGIRFFHCGEYGDKFMRPHYHACIFNFDFEDKKLWQIKLGNNLYTSWSLYDEDNPNSLWKYGYAIIGEVTFESAAYVARYITKKINGESAEKHYGERKPEYITMSRRPGIGREWYEKYKGDVYPSDEIIIQGKKMKPPRYYDSVYELDNPVNFAKIKGMRKQKAQSHQEDQTYDRLKTREKCQEARCNLLKRSYENV